MKNYQKNDLTIHWKQESCIHSGVCVKSLNTVFNPKERPWINADGAEKDKIMAAIDKCPSGALSYTLEKVETEKPNVSVTIVNNGPARIKGLVSFIDKHGNEELKDGVFAICRCGKSELKPFCDGTHKNITPPIDD